MSCGPHKVAVQRQLIQSNTSGKKPKHLLSQITKYKSRYNLVICSNYLNVFISVFVIIINTLLGYSY